MLSTVQVFGEVIARSAVSAGELLADRDLRRKAGTLVATQAQQRLKDLQQGVQSQLRSGLQEGPRQAHLVLERLQARFEQQRLAAMLQAERDEPVDVQVGPFLYEHAPQELRSRLWLALLYTPNLLGTAEARQGEGLSAAADGLLRSASCEGGAEPEQLPPLASTSSAAAADHAAKAGGHAGSAGTPQTYAASAGRGEGIPAAGQCAAGPAEPAAPSDGPLTEMPASPFQPQPQASSKETTYCAETFGAESSTARHSAGTVVGNSRQPAQGRNEPARGYAGEGMPPAASLQGARGLAVSPSVSASSVEGCTGRAQAGQGQQQAGGAGLEQWEMVGATGPAFAFGDSRLRAARLRAKRTSPSDDAAALQERLMTAIWAVPWPAPTEYDEDGRYNTLLQISIGQEECDEVIARDINRTFPEHPLFGFAQGQQALFRVLKAYSLHDLEVGYCQGMAFVTGLLLMYLPEEPAFAALARLLGPAGANLRRLYLPGLEGLKRFLRMYEWLLARLLPHAHAHLEAHGALPVLYASQWFLTAFACPFPAAFAARVLDVVLAEGRPHIMLRVALAVVAECEAALLGLHDFEDVVTHLKSEPLRWSPSHARIVLNTAMDGPVSDAMIAAAHAAVMAGYDGSLPRRTSSRPPPDAPAAAAPPPTPLRGAASGPPSPPAPASPAGPCPAATAASAPCEASQDAPAADGLGADYVEMVLAVERLV